MKLRTLVELLEDHDIPDFGVGVAKFAEDAQVQAPLQEIFKELIECYLCIIECFSTHERRISAFATGAWTELLTSAVHADDFEPLKSRFREAEDKIKDWQEEWKKRMAVAQEEEDVRRRSASMSSASNCSGLNGDRPTNVSFEYVSHLGRGTYGEVAAVREVFTDEHYARKLIRCTNSSHFEKMEVDVKKEVKVMNSLRHHHIASISFWTKDPEYYTFSIVMSPVGNGHLGDYLSGYRSDLKFGRQYDLWFGCLISALHHAHVKEIIHRDIKPSNIIIKDHQPYLADFGTAKDFSKLDSSVSIGHTVHGTPNYLAPEDRPRKAHGRETDIFSLGCVFAEMLTVRQGRNLEDFRECRRKPDQIYQYAFRDNLSRVREWLLGLECSPIPGFIRKQTLKMLEEDRADRPKTKDLKREFRGEDLVCDRCF